ncbi:MAG: electron transfer flavoprotein subunit alpha/FixB family protein [Candidatus Hadarchaeia archaeon]
MILIIAEHRMGEIRDTTYEMLSKANSLARELSTNTETLLLTNEENGLIESIEPWTDKILLSEDPEYENYNADIYRQAISQVISERNPSLVLMGQTSQGMDLAPALSAELDMPLLTNVIDIEKGESLKMERQIYGEKINSTVEFTKEDPYIITIRPGAFQSENPPELSGEIEKIEISLDSDEVFREFLEYIEPEEGEVDITNSEILVSIGRGIEDEENIEVVEELAEELSAHLAGTRPVIDNSWLPEDRLVGQTGKTVKPKLYLAIGISGQSNHVIGIKGSDTIVAVNKDAEAPIFQVADYGIVDDFMNVVPALTEKLRELS